KDSAPAPVFPLFERGNLMRAWYAALSFRLRRPPRSSVDVDADVMHELTPMLRVRRCNQLVAGYSWKRHGRHVGKFISPQTIEVFLFIINAGAFSIVSPAHEDVDGLKIAVKGKAWPGFVHRALEGHSIALRVSKDADLVVKQTAWWTSDV